MADALRPLLLVLVLMNLAFVQITDTVSAGWMLPLWALAVAAPVLCRLQERWPYRLAWNLGVVGAFGWLLRHALTSGLLHMLEDGLLLAALCQVHLLNNVGRRQRPDLLFFNSFLIAFVTSFFSADVSWSIVFVGYAATLVPALQLFIVVRAGGAPPGVTRAVLRDSLPRTLAVLVATALVFAFWPRDFERQGFIDHALRLAGAGQVAFDEPIRLGGNGAVSLSDREVLRIAPADGNPESVPAHWRGATYVEFDGSGWDPYQVMDFGSRRATDPLWQADEPHRWRRPGRRTGTTLRVRLLDDGGERLFAPLAATAIELPDSSTNMVIDPKGDAVLAFQRDGGGAPVEYRLALGAREQKQRFRVGTAAELRLRSVSLAQLPKTLLDLANAARATLPDDASPSVIAEGCCSYLQEHRRYALPGTAGAAEHLGEFVLGTGAGHCEYFATTLALMLRVQGIPCRVVGGYLATEWSEATREVVVREKHAHAWVEALLPGSVWTTLDATPASELQAAVNEPSTWQSLTAMLREAWASVTGFDGDSRTAALAWLRNLAPFHASIGASRNPSAAAGDRRRRVAPIAGRDAARTPGPCSRHRSLSRSPAGAGVGDRSARDYSLPRYRPGVAMRTACTLLLSGLTASLSAQEGPRVVRLEPPHLALAVEPKSQELVITFDRDMDTGGYSVCGGGTTFPQVEATSWRDARTFVIRASLQPQRAYAMELSCVTANGFRAKDGSRLAPQPWRLATAATQLADPQQKTRNEAAIARLETAIADRYSYRDRLGIDWHELVEDRRADLLAAPTDAALAVLLAEMLAAGQDPHISVRFQDGQLATSSRSTLPNFRSDALAKALPGLRKVNKIALAGRTDDGIGYLMLATFERGQRDAFEQAIEALRSLRDCKALVLDVRMNGGGDEMLAQRLAAFFVAEAKVYAAHRTRDPKAAEGFTERQDRSIRPNQPPDVFAGQVAVLMGPANMSSCEAFLLMMKQAPKAKLIGMTSAGSSGNPMPHTLAPGLQVLLPSWQALRADGSCFEGEGIAPDIQVDTDEAGFSETDPVLRAALDRLRGKQ